MNNSKLATKLIIILAVCGMATAFAQRGTAPLAHAMQFVPDGAPTVFFNDWTQIIRDLRSVMSVEIDVYDDDVVNTLASRHTFAAEFVIGIDDPWLLPDFWGFSFTEVDWELEILPGLLVLAVNDGFSWPAFRAVLDERGYETANHNGFETHHLEFDVANAWQDWMLDPLTYLQNVTFIESERILVAAVAQPALGFMLDTYVGALPTWSGADAGIALSEAPAAPFGAWVMPSEDACRYLTSGGFSVNAYNSAAVSVYRQGDFGYSNVVISYDTPALANADLQTRATMAIEHGNRGLDERDYYSLAEARVDGYRIWLELDQLDAMWRIFDLLLQGDFPAAGCAG